MKKHLNTLYVTTDRCLLKKERETVVIFQGKERLGQFPVVALESIVTFGKARLTPSLMQFCAAKNISISFLSPFGRFQARVVGPQSGNVLLRREQYRQADDPEVSKEFASAFVKGKIINSRNLLNRHIRNHPNEHFSNNFEKSISALNALLTKLKSPVSVDNVRGEEGVGAKIYFSCFDDMIRVKATDKNEQAFFSFGKRTKHPPLDPVNSMLSFIYTLLYHDCRSALETTGLDPYVGFLHRDRPGRAGLALDLMEELRRVY